jgi:hypothetical protein
MIQPLSICDIQALTTPRVSIAPTLPSNGPGVGTILLVAGIVVIAGYAIAVTVESKRNKELLIRSNTTLEQERRLHEALKQQLASCSQVIPSIKSNQV